MKNGTARHPTKWWGNSFCNIVSHFVHTSCVQDCVRITHKIQHNFSLLRICLYLFVRVRAKICENDTARYPTKWWGNSFAILSANLYTLLLCRIASAFCTRFSDNLFSAKNLFVSIRVRAKIHENDTAKVHDKMVRFFLVKKKHVDKSLPSLLRPGGVGHSHFVGRLSCLAGLAIL